MPKKNKSVKKKKRFEMLHSKYGELEKCAEMNEADIPIDIHIYKLHDWLVSRKIGPKNIQMQLKDIRNKITNALKDMPSNEQLIKLLTGTNINYFHCKQIVEILTETEKGTKNVFGSYGSQRMKDWQEIVRLYEKDNIYLVETSQIYVRNNNYEIPGLKKQMIKLEQQADECLKRIQDLAKPETQIQAEHTALLQQLGVKGLNLQEEFINVLNTLSEIYQKSIRNVNNIENAIDLYADCSEQKVCLPLLKHLVEFGNTTIYQYIHKEAPLSVEEPVLKLNITNRNSSNSGVATENEIDFGCDDNGGTSSTISAEIIDFGDLNLENNTVNYDLSETEGAEIDWGIETSAADNVEVSFDVPIEEYGIVVEGVGMDGGVAKGEQAYTLLDAPNYRNRILDELYELEAYLRMRLFELNQLDNSNNIMFALSDNISTHDSESIVKMLKNVDIILQEINCEQTRHLFQLKHSPKYADLLVSKLDHMTKGVEKIRSTKETLKDQAAELKQQRLELTPVLAELTKQTKDLQFKIEKDISKRYKNRVVHLIGGI
ncbi:CDK5RAP3-like protein [Teleopsis dalmanni]|uniref:CDK5RAP3-like protein n=1 Tax=Teleopsis dalmanni TaxID=139649 RepID=UPI0018CDE28B|nr:CDK5RAP3-like protein [Teleopsis dalmanni]